ncbi:MAG: sigma 54-interacting transcriptional regulator [Thermodesulfobacteriota bacterium]
MTPRKIQVGIIGSTQNFLRRAQSAALDQEFEIEYAQAGLEAAIPIGKKMEAEGKEVIISRRGTAHLLRENLSIPVLSVPLSSFDVLHNIKEASTQGRVILMTAFRGQIGRLELVEELLGVQIIPGVFHNTLELEQIILSSKQQGCEVVVGGGVSLALARKHGLPGVEVQTSEEAMGSTLENVRSVALAHREEKEKTLRYRTVIDSISEGIIAVDGTGLVTTINSVARSFFNLTEEKAVGRPIAEVLPATRILQAMEKQNAQADQIEKIGRDTFLVTHVPVKSGPLVVGGISTYKDIPNVLKAENEVRRSLAKRLIAKYDLEDIVHCSPAMRDLVKEARHFAEADSTVLIIGETGTGKELLAHGIHRLGPRRNGPFVSINCAALPDQLLESELFGYEEGAFTGSRRGGKPGLFELAHHGAIFLDEIGATSLSLQSRLLRVLQEREVMRVGGDRLIPVNVRIIAATNQNLKHEVQAGRFRDDLFFRLDVLTLQVPPLRHRLEDIPLLVEALTTRITPLDRTPIKIPAQGMEKLMRLSWPGNIRQLNNFIEKLIVLCGASFDPAVFDRLFHQHLDYSFDRRPGPVEDLPRLPELLKNKVKKDEVRLIRKALEDNDFNQTKAAGQLGISRVTLWRKIKTMKTETAASSLA